MQAKRTKQPAETAFTISYTPLCVLVCKRHSQSLKIFLCRKRPLRPKILLQIDCNRHLKYVESPFSVGEDKNHPPGKRGDGRSCRLVVRQCERQHHHFASTEHTSAHDAVKLEKDPIIHTNDTRDHQEATGNMNNNNSFQDSILLRDGADEPLLVGGSTGRPRPRTFTFLEFIAIPPGPMTLPWTMRTAVGAFGVIATIVLLSLLPIFLTSLV